VSWYPATADRRVFSHYLASSKTTKTNFNETKPRQEVGEQPVERYEHDDFVDEEFGVDTGLLNRVFTFYPNGGGLARASNSTLERLDI